MLNSIVGKGIEMCIVKQGKSKQKHLQATSSSAVITKASADFSANFSLTSFTLSCQLLP